MLFKVKIITSKMVISLIKPTSSIQVELKGFIMQLILTIPAT